MRLHTQGCLPLTKLKYFGIFILKSCNLVNTSLVKIHVIINAYIPVKTVLGPLSSLCFLSFPSFSLSLFSFFFFLSFSSLFPSLSFLYFPLQPLSFPPSLPSRFFLPFPIFSVVGRSSPCPPPILATLLGHIAHCFFVMVFYEVDIRVYYFLFMQTAKGATFMDHYF